MFSKQRSNSDVTLSCFHGHGGDGLAVAGDVLAGGGDWFVEESS